MCMLLSVQHQWMLLSETKILDRKLCILYIFSGLWLRRLLLKGESRRKSIWNSHGTCDSLKASLEQMTTFNHLSLTLLHQNNFKKSIARLSCCSLAQSLRLYFLWQLSLCTFFGCSNKKPRPTQHYSHDPVEKKSKERKLKICEKFSCSPGSIEKKIGEWRLMKHEIPHPFAAFQDVAAAAKKWSLHHIRQSQTYGLYGFVFGTIQMLKFMSLAHSLCKTKSGYKWSTVRGH